MSTISLIQKVGNSPDNIIEIANVLNQNEHRKIFSECKSLKFTSGTKDPDDFWFNRLSYSDELNKEILEILKKIFNVAQKSIEDRYGISVINKQNYNITVWRPAMSMHPHIDDADYKDYNFAALFYINDNYYGGEINFVNFNKMVKPKANSLLIFPGHDAYLHEVKTIIKGHRYTSSLWFSFLEEDHK